MRLHTGPSGRDACPAPWPQARQKNLTDQAALSRARKMTPIMRTALLLVLMPIWHCAVMMKFSRPLTERPLRRQSSVAARLCRGPQFSRSGSTISSSSGNPSSRSSSKDSAGSSWSGSSRRNFRSSRPRLSFVSTARVMEGIRRELCCTMFRNIYLRSDAETWSICLRHSGACWRMTCRPMTWNGWNCCPGGPCRIAWWLCSSSNGRYIPRYWSRQGRQMRRWWLICRRSWRPTPSTGQRCGFFGHSFPAGNSWRCSSGSSVSLRTWTSNLALSRPRPPRGPELERLLCAGKRWRRWRFRRPPTRPRPRRRRRHRPGPAPLLAVPAVPGLLSFLSFLLVSGSCCEYLYSSLTRVVVGGLLYWLRTPAPSVYCQPAHRIHSKGHPGPKSRDTFRGLRTAWALSGLVLLHLLSVASASPEGIDVRVGGQSTPGTPWSFRFCAPSRYHEREQ